MIYKLGGSMSKDADDSDSTSSSDQSDSESDSRPPEPSIDDDPNIAIKSIPPGSLSTRNDPEP